VLELNNNPAEFAKLTTAQSLIPNRVPEIIHLSNTTNAYAKTRHQDHDSSRPTNSQRRKGEKVVMWYVSGNRLTDMPRRIVWKEILKRFDRIEVVGEPPN
jgi:hypothetical protein